jgi:hypothetical protein
MPVLAGNHLIPHPRTKPCIGQDVVFYREHVRVPVEEDRPMAFVELLHKALHDREFAKRIISDPEGALKELGETPTPEKIRALKDASCALMSAKIAFDVETADNL